MDSIEHKHLDREQFQELLEILECYEPDHPLTMWVRRAFCVNDGDSTLHCCSLVGHKILQWDKSVFDDEDNDCYEEWFGDGDTNDWEFDDD